MAFSDIIQISVIQEVFDSSPSTIYRVFHEGTLIFRINSLETVIFGSMNHLVCLLKKLYQSDGETSKL